jgi:hypothetical protein
MFTWCRRRRSFVSNLCLIYLVSLILRVYDIRCLWDLLSYASRDVPAWLYICNRARVYKCSSRIRIRTFLLRLQVIFESLYVFTSIISQTRYTNLWIPEGHTHVSSPRDSTWVASSGWVSKLQIFNPRLLQSLTSPIFNFFKLRFLQSSTSSNFDFFNLRLHISLTSWNMLSRWE